MGFESIDQPGRSSEVEQCTPPPGMEKLKYQVNVTFWFWLMYPPPRNGKVEISGQCDILVLADVPPPPRIEINMNAIENN